MIGIGASAGGLEALEQFLCSVPADGGMAFVVVQHQEPEMLWGMAMVVFADVPASTNPPPQICQTYCRQRLDRALPGQEQPRRRRQPAGVAAGERDGRADLVLVDGIGPPHQSHVSGP
ncbi:MAG TPA: chemotaxis protein CheB [Candidatus Competibacter sp.]|nr:chemotaxis protein CheB [Candidatus Competibacter sp.]